MKNKFFLSLHRYLFRSGNHEHPSDKFYNTTVEVLPDQLSEESVIWQQYNTTTDGYLIIGSFNAFGVAEGSVDGRIGKLRELRLHCHAESENWVILSEVSYLMRTCFVNFAHHITLRGKMLIGKVLQFTQQKLANFKKL